MSIIHVNQIKHHVTRLFNDLIDLIDITNPSQREDFLLTRGLAAYAVHFLSGVPAATAARAVTDGGGDNGIDAIYFDETNRRLYLVQSKWIKNGSGEPDNGEVKKFIGGIHDLFNMEFTRFNAKVQSMEPVIEQALDDPNTRYEVVLAYTGTSTLAEPSRRDLEDLKKEMNDTSEVLFTTVLNQSGLHSSLVSSAVGEPINLQIGIKEWGRKPNPHEAFYGQVSGDQIAEWWSKYRTRLFARNLRSMLGETDVNAEIRQTLEQRGEAFWYFNNGITIVACRAQRAMAGGASRDFATFHCDDISVVNGAQTVGTIGKFAETFPDKCAEILVPVRIIVRGDDVGFGEEVTKTNNRQNRIENRDFVSLDPEQSRVRSELAIDGVDYQLVRSESVTRTANSFDLVDATTALACASGKVRLVVQLKREIGKLWEDVSKAPYKELFNPDVPGLYIWRAVQAQRRIDEALESRGKRGGSVNTKRKPIATHGNRIIAALVFASLPTSRFRDPAFDYAGAASSSVIMPLVDDRLEKLVAQLKSITLTPSFRHFSKTNKNVTIS
ncbi:MAG: AIPR family protein [Nitrospira sp.]|nr:AIPR family protein [Nitrospira sp.]